MKKRTIIGLCSQHNFCLDVDDCFDMNFSLVHIGDNIRAIDYVTADVKVYSSHECDKGIRFRYFT